MDGSVMDVRRGGEAAGSLGAWAGLAAALYGVLALVSLGLMRSPGHAAALWYADAAAVLMLLARPRGDGRVLLLAVAGADLVVRVVAQHLPGATAAGGGGLLTSGLVLADVSAIALAAHGLRSRCDPAQAVSRAGALLKALLLGALLPAFVGGAIALGVTALALPFVSAASPAGGGSALGFWLGWVEVHGVGSMALLPLGLLVLARGWRPVVQGLQRPAGVLVVALSVLLAAWAPTALPFPFFYLLIVLVVAAAVAKFAGAALAVLLSSLVLCGLITSGVFVPPVSPGELAGRLLFAPRIIDTIAPGAVLLYLPVLLTLVPPLLLATMLERIDIHVAALAEREASFRLVYQKTPVMMHSVDPQRRLLDVNEEWLARLGYRRDEVIGRPSTEFLTPASRRRAEESVIPRFMREGALRDVDYQLLTKTGETVDVLLSAIWESDDRGRPLRTLSVFKDVTEQKRLAAELAAEKARIEVTLQSMSYLAHHDGLTGLPNRVLFEDRVHQACHFGHRHQQRFVVVFMDLDHFKQVNDTLGHAVGDELLKLVAERLTATLRGSDTVCRLGGDEFVMLLSEVDGDAAAAEVAQKILREAAAPCTLDGTPLSISLSMGLALFPRDGETPALLMKHADAAMYRAKREGRSRYCIYSPSADAAPTMQAAVPVGQSEVGV